MTPNMMGSVVMESSTCSAKQLDLKIADEMGIYALPKVGRW